MLLQRLLDRAHACIRTPPSIAGADRGSEEPAALRLARDKRRLEIAAIEAGCSRSVATRVVAIYFRGVAP